MQLLLAFHLVGAVLWIGTLLTIARILVVHAQEPASVRPRFSHLERRLDSYSAVPGALVTLVTGLVQIGLEPAGYFRFALWLHIKLVLVIVMFGVHLVLSLRLRKLTSEPADQPIGKGLFAAMHGTLGLLLVGVVVLAELRPMSGG